MLHWNKLDDLSGLEVYEMFMLRQQVFMLEQNCLYQDIDDHDSDAIHGRYLNNKGALIGYLRILNSEKHGDLSIGRVAVKRKIRRRGVAAEMMQAAVQLCAQQYPKHIIRLAAQTYLVDFYSRFGFVEVGQIYIEDDIPHQDMQLTPVF